MSYGILIVSHVEQIAQGVPKLLKQVAPDIAITFAGGTDDHEIGTSLAKITAALEENSATEILAFYDLGSAKMNLEMAGEFSTKPVHLYDTALVEGAYVSASLLQAGVDLPEIEKQLELLQINGDL